MNIMEKKTALLLIDIQNMYFEEGCCRLENPEKAAENAAKVISVFRENRLPVIHIKHRFDTENCPLDGDYLREIHKTVSPTEGEIVIEKTRPSSFYGTALRETLEKLGIERLIVAGMMSHMCVDTTVRAASDLNYEIILADDACADKELWYRDVKVEARDSHFTFMAALGEGFAKLMRSEEIVKLFG